MNLHEYQAKEILRRFGIPVPQGEVARSPEEAEKIVAKLGGNQFVVKAQIHAGGRGKAGGVVLVSSRSEVKPVAQRLLGAWLRTPQTGPLGQPVDQVLIQIQTEIKKEFYAAVVLDRSQEKPCLIFSEAGGMEIEEVAKKNPQAIKKKIFSPFKGLTKDEIKTFLAECTGGVTPPNSKGRGNLAPTNEGIDPLSDILSKLTTVFLETDANLVEVNPLAQTPSGEFLAVDAKIRLDDNGLERHPELAALYDPHQEDPREIEAKKFGLSYVGLEGNIGCMVNGAGLAMATMDLIKLAGGEPANFLDVGGGASKEKVTAAFKIILQDPKVQAILVNIFGGIMRCDIIAEGILAAVIDVGARSPRPKGAETAPLPLPLVVRLEGTKAKEGKEILKKSGLQINSAESLEEAAKKVVSCVGSR